MINSEDSFNRINILQSSGDISFELNSPLVVGSDYSSNFLLISPKYSVNNEFKESLPIFYNIPLIKLITLILLKIASLYSKGKTLAALKIIYS